MEKSVEELLNYTRIKEVEDADEITGKGWQKFWPVNLDLFNSENSGVIDIEYLNGSRNAVKAQLIQMINSNLN